MPITWETFRDMQIEEENIKALEYHKSLNASERNEEEIERDEEEK